MMINAQISRQTTIKSTNTVIGYTIIDNSSEITALFIFIVLISFYFIHKRLKCSAFNLLKRDTYVINIINKTETVSERFSSSP